MKNRLLVFAIALGGIFLSGGTLKAKILTCKAFEPSAFPHKENCQAGESCWDVNHNELEIHFSQQMNGVQWIGEATTARNEVQKLTQIAYPRAWIDVRTQKPACVYTFIFDSKKESNVEVLVHPSEGEYIHCTKTDKQNELKCDEPA